MYYSTINLRVENMALIRCKLMLTSKALASGASLHFQVNWIKFLSILKC